MSVAVTAGMLMEQHGPKILSGDALMTKEGSGGKSTQRGGKQDATLTAAMPAWKSTRYKILAKDIFLRTAGLTITMTVQKA